MRDPLPNPFLLDVASIPDVSNDKLEEETFTLDPNAFMAAIAPDLPHDEKHLGKLERAPSVVGTALKSCADEFDSYVLERLAKLRSKAK